MGKRCESWSRTWRSLRLGLGEGGGAWRDENREGRVER